MHAQPRSVTPTRTTVLLWIIAAAFAPAALGDEPAPPSVAVSGVATTEVVPDQLIWRIRIHNTGSKLSDVAAEHAIMVRATLEFLKRNDLEGADVQTSQMKFGENRECQNGSWIKQGYYADTEASFKLMAFDKYDALWIGLAELAGVSVDSVVFDHAKRIEYQNETRRKALVAARDKAADLAHTLGAELGEPLSIEEDLALYQTNNRNPYSNCVQFCDPREMAEPGETLAPGTIPIRMRVKAVFRLVAPATSRMNAPPAAPRSAVITP